MIVEQIWTANAWRNFNYLVACEETGEALAIDPLDADKCLSKASENGWTIRWVVNTHEHGDHTGGNDAILAATGASLMAHARAPIAGVERGLQAGDILRLGHSAELEVLDTPGHTMSHVCLLAHADSPALFSGDTLFNAGAGNCHNGGHPEQLYDTFSQQLDRLPEQTLIYPGHDYIENNLRFTLDREPDNVSASKLLAQLSHHDPAQFKAMTLAQEREINTFFRLGNKQLIARLRETESDLPADPTPREVFLKLRELRNRW